MLAVFFTFFLVHDTAVGKIEPTGLLFSIGSEEVVVSDKGQVYILNYNNAFVKVFDGRGKPKGQMAVNNDGSRASTTEPDSVTKHVIDPIGKKAISSIRQQDKPFPIDEDWVAGKTKYMKEKRARMGMHGPCETNVPEFFPPIRSLIMDPNDNLVVNKWRGRPEQKRELVFMDPAGKGLEPTLSWDELIRLMKIVDGKWVYVTFFDSGLDEAGIAKIKDINDFISHNPIFCPAAKHRPSLAEPPMAREVGARSVWQTVPLGVSAPLRGMIYV